jgi:hypothetical protein
VLQTVPSEYAFVYSDVRRELVCWADQVAEVRSTVLFESVTAGDGRICVGLK